MQIVGLPPLPIDLFGCWASSRPFEFIDGNTATMGSDATITRVKWWPGTESNHRHAYFQFACKTVSYGNLWEFRQTRSVQEIIEKALMNKRLGTIAHSGEISALHLNCTF